MLFKKIVFILFYTTLYYLSISIAILSYNNFEVILLKPLKEKISITIDNDILAKLKEKAEYDDRSLSIYKHCFETTPKRNRRKKQAIKIHNVLF